MLSVSFDPELCSCCPSPAWCGAHPDHRPCQWTAVRLVFAIIIFFLGVAEVLAQGPTASLTASPATVVPGQLVTLTWQCTNSTSAFATATPSGAAYGTI